MESLTDIKLFMLPPRKEIQLKINVSKLEEYILFFLMCKFSIKYDMMLLKAITVIFLGIKYDPPPVFVRPAPQRII